MKRRLEPKFQVFVTFDFEPFKLKKLYFAYYLRYCSAIFTHDVNNIVYLFNSRILNAFNIVKVL